MRPRRAPWGALSLGLAFLGQAPAALGAEGTEIASAMDEGDPFDLLLTVEYQYSAKRAAIKREYAGLDGSTPDGPMPIAKDLLYTQDRHTITPRLQLGLFHDFELNFALPIVLSDTRSMEFDQRETPCDFMGDDATCIDEGNSSTLRDELLPVGNGSFGYDANDPTTNFAPGSKKVFNGVNRAGLDQVHVGLAWAPLSQERDDTKPTWVVGGEFRFAVGDPMRVDRFNPSLEDSVGRGYHEFRFQTAISRRTAWAEPFVQFWWQTPLPGTGDAPPELPGEKVGSQFWDMGFGQDSVLPQQHAGTVFGFNGIPYQDKATQQSLMIEVRGAFTGHFQGRGYSEMWEVFALAGDVSSNPNAPLAVDRDPTSNIDVPIDHPGVTTIENYLSFAGRLGVRAQLGERAKFNAGFQLEYDQAHRISWTDAGRDTNQNREVDPLTDEVNPLFNRRIDLPGRRYLVDESITYSVIVAGTIMF